MEEFDAVAAGVAQGSAQAAMCLERSTAKTLRRIFCAVSLVAGPYPGRSPTKSPAHFRDAWDHGQCLVVPTQTVTRARSTRGLWTTRPTGSLLVMLFTCTILGDVPRTHHLGAACQSRYLVQGHLEKWYTGCRDGCFSLVNVVFRCDTPDRRCRNVHTRT